MSYPPESPLTGVSAELVNRELETILASPPFKNANRLSRFLRYIVEQSLGGNAESLKEYQIGLAVFERGPEYDTRIDPVVRVEARQLRLKLANYYETLGSADEIVISLPKGGYAPCVEQRRAKPAGEPLLPGNHEHAFGHFKRSWRWTVPVLAGGAAVFAFVALISPAGEPVVHWVKSTLGFGNPVAARTGPHRAANPEAEALYLRGRYYWNKRTPESLNQAVDWFTQSIVRDPGYAPAYAGLADAYNLLSEYTTMPYREAFTRAIAAARKAVELDDSLANAHASLAFASFWGAWDAATAEREFKRALELNPNYVLARHWYATFLMTRGRSREALSEIEQAQKQDPASTSILADKAVIQFNGGQREQAIALLKQIEASEPAFLSPHSYLADIYLDVGKYPEYLSEYKNMAVLSHDAEAIELITAEQEGFAAGGSRGMLEAMFKTQLKFSSAGHPHNYEMARTCALLGEKRKALEYLEAALDQRETGMLVLRIDTAFNALHGDSAFQNLLTRVGQHPLS